MYVLSNFIKQSWLVIVAALVFGLLVATIHGQLEGKIAENAREKLEREMKFLLGQDSTFEAVPDEAGENVLYYAGKDMDGQLVGYAFAATGGGFADKITLLVAVDGKMEKLLGIAVLKTNETPGFGDKMKEPYFKGQFSGCPSPAAGNKLTVAKTGEMSKVDREIIAITGATVTSEAVVKIVNDAVLEMRKKIEIIKDN